MAMNPTIADGMIEMNVSTNNGKSYEDYRRHQPVVGKVKVRDSAPEFAAAFFRS
jgi:hypothetical protein